MNTPTISLFHPDVNIQAYIDLNAVNLILDNLYIVNERAKYVDLDASDFDLTVAVRAEHMVDLAIIAYQCELPEETAIRMITHFSPAATFAAADIAAIVYAHMHEAELDFIEWGNAQVDPYAEFDADELQTAQHAIILNIAAGDGLPADVFTLCHIHQLQAA